jgi:hypothetical protein
VLVVPAELILNLGPLHLEAGDSKDLQIVGNAAHIYTVPSSKKIHSTLALNDHASLKIST